MILTDYHCHILPEIDDGSDSVETSLSMIETMKNQGVERIVATPHFYAHREKSVESYIEKRRESYEKLVGAAPAIKDIRLGAEVAVEHGISELDGLDRLAFQGTDIIMLELPYSSYSKWISEEVYNVSCRYGLKVVLAHIHRYINFYTKSQMSEILSMNVIFQVNNEAFSSFGERRFVKRLIKDGYPVVFGSDSHNMTSRLPNWDILLKKADTETIEKSCALLDKYC